MCTVTGNIKSLTGGALANGTIVFTLTSYPAGSLPRVLGSNSLFPTSVTVTTDGSGNFSVVIPGNDTIDPASTQYNVTIIGSQNQIGPVTFSLIGSSANLNSAPATLPFTPAIPSTILNQNNTWTGNQVFQALVTFSGGLSVGRIVTTPLTVTFSATPTFDCSQASIFIITLTGNVTSSTLANALAGQLIIFKIIQDGAGGHTFAWPANVKGGSVPINTTASASNVQMFFFDGANAVAVAPLVSF